jgi:hypothetical protein
MMGEKSKSITRSFVSLTEAVRERLSDREDKIAVEIPEKMRVGS